MQEHLGRWPGPIIDEESGRAVAVHQGFWFYTIGQRSGLDLGDLPNGPWYVVRKDPRTNAVYVSREYHSVDKARNSFGCDSFNWIGPPPAEVVDGRCADGQELLVKIRHGPETYAAQEFKLHNGGTSATVQLPRNDQGLATGQYAAFYQGGVCLGCGVICETDL
jgi:tRNA-5-taurinomethyluridine 2-sulfurtransferase